MENILQEIKQFYGVEVAKYCKMKNVKLKKVKSGAILFDNFTNIRECSEILKSQIDESLFTNFLVKVCNIPESSSKKPIYPLKEKIYKEDNDYLKNVNPKVILRERSSYVSFKNSSNNCIFDICSSGRKIYDNIIRSKEGIFDKTEIDSELSNHLIPILKRFQQNHKNYSYKYHFNRILKNESTDKCLNSTIHSYRKVDDIEIKTKDICYVFGYILRKIVPLELFGSFRNVEVINKIIYAIVNSRRFQPIYLKKYIKLLNINQIKWLKFIKEESIKYHIICTLIIWFINNYFYKILNKLYYWTQHPEAIGKRLFIKIGKWKAMKRNFIRDFIRKNTLIGSFKNNSISPKCEFKLNFKNSGIRPIAKTSYTAEEKAHMLILLKFLSQLCVKEYGIVSMAEFRNKFKTIGHERNNSDKEYTKIWLVVCDIDDAFGSIILDKLYYIIRTLCKDLPRKLFLKRIVSIPVRRKTGNLILEPYFTEFPQSLPIGTIFAFSNLKTDDKYPTFIMKEKLLNDIKKCIFGQEVTIGQKKYLVSKKGILQGTILSNIFSNIYYNYIYHQKLSGFINSGLLFRYVDDTIYISENKESAEKFLKIINEGFPEYNCSFKKPKIQTNLPSQIVHATNEINFLGHEINCFSLESVPSFKDAHFSHLFTVIMRNKKHLNHITMFKQRISNCSYLRLSKMILHDSSISAYQFLRIVKKISIMQAWRAYVFIQKLFGNPYFLYRDCQQIFCIIKQSNKKILQIFLQYYMEGNKNIFNRKIIKNKIWFLLWSGYRQAFSTNKDLQNLYGDGIKREIMKYKKLVKPKRLNVKNKLVISL
ncbi:hypothetical protein M0802_012550 [Mischocyttarus mexicanus]|nr:hypothetical protein M0802_012550 [Mischocyttarus mexicanus]